MHCQLNSQHQKQLSRLRSMLRLGTLGREGRGLEQHSQLHSSRERNARSRLLSKAREGRPCRLGHLGRPGREGTGLKRSRQLHSSSENEARSRLLSMGRLGAPGRLDSPGQEGRELEQHSQLHTSREYEARSYQGFKELTA